MRAHTHSLTLTHTHTYTHAHPHKALPPNPLQVAEQQGRYLAAMLNEEAKNTGAEPKDFVYNHLVRSGGVMGAGRGVLGVSVAS
jgi:NADH dehydrogenase FAD-containing subunit